MRWECGECLDCCFYSFVVWYVGLKGSDVKCEKILLCGSGVGIWRMVLYP